MTCQRDIMHASAFSQGLINQAAVGLIFSVVALSMSNPANADYATGGSGAYRNNILWFDWGDHGSNIAETGISVTNTQIIAGNPLAVTCTLSNITGTGTAPNLQVYIPGDYFEDGLDDLYNIGGKGTANTMEIGVKNREHGKEATFTYSCSATLNGTPFQLDGLVLADAESSNVGEFTRAVLPAGATMRVIEHVRAPGCSTDYNVNRNSNSYEYRSTAPNTCYSNDPNSPTPAGVFFIDNATTADITIHGGGKQAIAVGVMVQFGDSGDAPASYGAAVHHPQFSWVGGELPEGDTEIFNSGFALASLIQPSTAVLGARVDVEHAPWYGDGASQDDSHGGEDDEDGVNIQALAPLHPALAGSFYQVPVICLGTSPVAGWIDFDRNGVFDVDERSATVNCAGGTATLSWTVNNTISVGSSYLRVRTAINASDIATPDGAAASGEVEDYAISISQPHANDDNVSDLVTGTPTTVNVLANDTTFSTPIVPSSVRIVGTAASGDPLVVAGEGTWTVNPANGAITFTPLGGFVGDPTPIRYTVADQNNLISVSALVTLDYLTINAVNDDFSGAPVSTNGGTRSSVFANDSLNDAAFVPAAVSISLLNNGGIAGLVLNAEGSFTVPAFTAGSYTATYRICDTAHPTICDDATAVIVIGQPQALEDSSLSNLAGNPVVIDVLLNDETVAAALVPASVQIVGTANPGDPFVVFGEGTWSINTGNGEITFTPEGGFTGNPNPIRYTVDDADVNTSNQATVTVGYLSINAVNDDFTALPIASSNGGTTTSIFANDRLNNAVFTSSSVVAALQDIDGITGLLLNTDGTLWVPPGTPAGVYSVQYQICRSATPATPCDSANVTLRINGTLTVAPNSDVTWMNQPVTTQVTGNDSFPAGSTITTSGTSTQGGTVTCSAGQCTYTPPADFIGTDTYSYRVCEPAPDNNACASTTVTISVRASLQAIPVAPWWLFTLGITALALTWGRKFWAVDR